MLLVDASQSELSEQAVVDYLRHHPHFFQQHDALLTQLSIPHQRGDTISLVERQIALLRERNVHYHQQLIRQRNQVSETAHQFDKLRQLTVALLESADLGQLVDVLNDSLSHDFFVEDHTLILFSERGLNLPARVAPREVVFVNIGSLLSSTRPLLGRLPDNERHYLFVNSADEMQSCAVIPLNNPLMSPSLLGVLVLGSRDKQCYQPQMDTVVWEYLADVFSRLLKRFMD